MVPQRGTETFISTIGHLDERVDLYTGREIAEADTVQREGILKPQIGNRALMDLCMMASKLAYENDKVIKSVVNRHWKASFSNLFKDYYSTHKLLTLIYTLRK